MIAPLALVVLLSLPFLYVLARRPILRRLALRNAVRRPREATLVVLGSLLGAAIVTGSLVVGDTMTASIRQVVHTHLGPVDELVSTQGPSQQRLLLRELRRLEPAQVDGVLPLATLEAATTSTGPRVLAAPQTQLLALDFDAARRFGGDAYATGMSGPTPALGHAAISRDLAGALGVSTGDRIAVHAYGQRTPLIVDRVLPRRGLAGFSLDPAPEAQNVLVSWETFDRLRVTRADGQPPTWSVAVSNRGGVEDGAEETDAVVAHLERAAAAADVDAQVYTAKRTIMDAADAVGESFTSMFTATGSFGVLAGLLLLVNLFVMLAAERKTELGMARAVGMRRAALVGAFATEGWLYAVVSSVLGVLLGVGLGALLVEVTAAAMTSEHSRLEIEFALRPASLALAFAIGFAVALLTIVGTSLRVSRLNIIRAIRDLPEPPPRRPQPWRLVVAGFAAAAGVALTANAVEPRDGFGLLLGPALAIVGLAPFAARLVSSSAANSGVSLLVVAWAASLFAVVPATTRGAGIMLYVVQGVVLTAAAVVLVSFQQERLSRVLRRLSGRRSLSLRLGLAYPLARRSRTALTIAMYALVVFILTFITSLAHMIEGEIDTATANVRGGYQVIVDSSAANPVAAAQLAELDGVVHVAPLARTTGFFRVDGARDDAPWPLTAFDERFVAGRPPKLQERGSYATDREAWNAVLRDPSLAIVDPSFLQIAGGPSRFTAELGSKLTVVDPTSGRTRTLTIAALAPVDYLVQNGLLYGAEGARTLFGREPALDRLYVALRPDIDADAFADAVQTRYLSHGAEAVSFAAIMAESFTMTRQIFQLFQGYLALGLLVGIAGTAVVMIRAVRERRRQIGTLRALGFGRRMVGRSFAIETATVAVEGSVIGCALALVTLYDIVALSDSFGEMTFSIPYLQLMLLLVGTVGAALLATVWPTVAASRIRPAVALRMTD
jgi:putative ABC transport system permease protein